MCHQFLRNVFENLDPVGLDAAQWTESLPWAPAGSWEHPLCVREAYGQCVPMLWVKANPIMCCRFCLCWNVTCVNLFCSDHAEFSSWSLASVLERPKGYQNRSIFQKPSQQMPANDTTEWKETCWKLLHGRQMSLLPWPQHCLCDDEQRPSLSLHAQEGSVSLSSRTAHCPHQYFSQAMVHCRSGCMSVIK